LSWPASSSSTQDGEEGARWLRRSAEAGDQASQADLANLVARGGGEPEDQDRIARWFADGAIAGDLQAAFNIGMCFAKGVGIDRD